jgi:hypothetical protein
VVSWARRTRIDLGYGFQLFCLRGREGGEGGDWVGARIWVKEYLAQGHVSGSCCGENCEEGSEDDCGMHGGGRWIDWSVGDNW